MNNGQISTVAGVDISQLEPTAVAIKDLHDWVIWQFPGTNSKAHHAAVKPSIPGHGWYPATIDINRMQVTIYGNVEEPLESPEAASRKLTKLLTV